MAEPARKQRRERGTRTSSGKRVDNRTREASAPAPEPQADAASPASVSALALAAKRLKSWVQALDNYHRNAPDENPVPGFIRDSLAQLEQLRDARPSEARPSDARPSEARPSDARPSGAPRAAERPDRSDAELSWGPEEPGRYVDGRWVVNPKWTAHG